MADTETTAANKNIVNLYFNVEKQLITRTDTELLASGAVNTIIANFKFCNTWKGLATFCRFEGAGGFIDVEIENDKCVIPWEVIEAPSFTMACWGTKSTDTVLTTKKLTVKVYQSVNLIAEEPLPATPKLIEIYSELAQHDLSDLAFGSDLEAETKARIAAIEEGTSKRISSNAVLQNNIDNEVKARKEADAKKVDKGGNEQVTFAMLAQEVKTAMTGNKVAVVGENGVNTRNIVNGAVTESKLNDDVANKLNGFVRNANAFFICGDATIPYFERVKNDLYFTTIRNTPCYFRGRIFPDATFLPVSSSSSVVSMDKFFELVTSPNGVENCVVIPHNKILVYNANKTLELVDITTSVADKLPIFAVSMGRVFAGAGQYLWDEYQRAALKSETNANLAETNANLAETNANLAETNANLAESIKTPTEITQLMRGGTSKKYTTYPVFLHFSDIHNDATRLKNIIDYANNHDFITDVFCTGDMVQSRYINGISAFAQDGAKKILTVIGNHDTLRTTSGYDFSQIATQEELYTQFFRPFVANWGVTMSENTSYWYKDYADYNLRVIGLDGMLWDDATQLTWLETVLSGAYGAGYAVIILEHFPPANQTRIDCTFNSTIGNVGFTVNGRGTTLSETVQEKVKSFMQRGGEFICYLCGHYHTDHVFYNSNFADQLFIVIDSASLSQSNSWNDTYRVAGTKSENLFNLFSYDTVNHLVKIVRIGANVNSEMKSKKLLAINYKTMEVIANS